VVCLWLVAFAIQAFEYLRHPHLYYGQVWGGAQFDAGGYIRLAQLVGRGVPAGAKPYHGADHFFLGLPSLIALTAAVAGVSEAQAIVGLSVAASIVSCVLICRLYGSVVALAFGIVSLDWLQASVVGASEPLFTALLLGSFACARGERWAQAALLASLATTVRPVGVLALIALAVVLACARKPRDLASIVAISLTTAAVYFWWAGRTMGDPFVNFKLYSETWTSSSPVGLPFAMLVASAVTQAGSPHAAAHARALALIPFTLAVAVIGATRDRFRLFRAVPVEAITAALTLCFVSSYNFIDLALYWPRFVAPILPTLLYAVKDWIPTSRWILWPSLVVSALLASSELVGFRAVFGFGLLRH
jgi:hypothetical protein